jgi:NAD(P)-dependent dehydrogenase (short-subunit alcohol dehydrogenase family)
MTMASMPEGYRALVIGASGGIGSAFVETLRDDARCGGVEALHRRSTPAIDFDDESSIAGAASALSGRRFHLVINAVGVLHGQGFMPEKKLGDLNQAQLLATFRANTIGPALLIRHFAPLLEPDRAVMAMISAKVGSIGDNRLGGWYGYRASKAALNMIVKTASIELGRTAPGAVIVALHPGTVDTALSAPFRGARIGRPPATAAAEMLAVLDALTADDSGSFVAYDGTRLPW